MVSLCQGACAFMVKSVDYNVQPNESINPPNEIVSLIKANTDENCVSEPTFDSTVIAIKRVCTHYTRPSELSSHVIRLDQIATISLSQAGNWYVITVKHTGHTREFRWWSKSLDDMKRLANAIAALSPSSELPKQEAAQAL